MSVYLNLFCYFSKFVKIASRKRSQVFHVSFFVYRRRCSGEYSCGLKSVVSTHTDGGNFAEPESAFPSLLLRVSSKSEPLICRGPISSSLRQSLDSLTGYGPVQSPLNTEQPPSSPQTRNATPPSNLQVRLEGGQQKIEIVGY